MPNYRGSAIVLLRHLFSQPNNCEAKFLATLNTEAKNIYTSALSGSWIPIEPAEIIIKAAAKILYPDTPDAFVRLGYAHAEKNLNGIYKSILKVLTPVYAIEQSGSIWKLIFDKGDPEFTIDKKLRTAEMIVKNFPKLPLLFREMTNGHIQCTIKYTGATHVQLQRDDTNPNAWRWWGSWEQ